MQMLFMFDFAFILRSMTVNFVSFHFWRCLELFVTLSFLNFLLYFISKHVVEDGGAVVFEA